MAMGRLAGNQSNVLGTGMSRSLNLCKSAWVLGLIALALLLGQQARAQVLYGALNGIVTDSTGAAVAGAKVTAVETEKGLRKEGTTDGTGLYRLPELLPGTWKITVKAAGFNTAETPGIKLGPNSMMRVDEVLQVGQANETVTVSTAPPELQTDRADVHVDITPNQIQQLPAISSEGKNFQALLKLIPGATLPSENNSAAANTSRAMTSNVNGQSSQGNGTRLDGILDAYPWLPNNVAYVPPADAIESVNVTTNSFDAEQGTVNGAAVNVITKTGSNKFHGTAHEFHTDDQLKNMNYFSAKGALRPLNIFNQYGASLGGPIKRDKLFFFADFESTRQIQAPANGNPQTVPNLGLVYSTAKQAGYFDFRGFQSKTYGLVDSTGTAAHIYDPRTGNADGTNRQPISCGGLVDTICLSDVDPAALKLAAMVPEPTSSVASKATNNFISTGKGKFNRDNYDSKVTYVQSDKTNYFGRFSFSNGFIFDPPSLGAVDGNATNGGQIGNAYSHIYVVGLGATHTFTQNLLLDANVGFTRQRLNAMASDVATAKDFGLSTLGIAGTNNASDANNQLYWGIPFFSFVTFTNLGNSNTGNPFLFRDNQFVGDVNMTWLHKHHEFRGGFELNHAQINHFQPQGGSFQTARGSFKNTGVVTEQVSLSAGKYSATNAPTTLQYNSYADFLLGLPAESGHAIQNSSVNAIRWNQFAAYVRDQWQATPKLSVSYGLRWERYPMAYSDNGSGMRVLDPATMKIYIGGHGTVPVNDNVETGMGMFLPRLGVAYRPTDKTVIRAGGGIAADSNNWRFLRNCFPAVTLSDYTGSATGGSTNYTQFAPAASYTGKNGASYATGPYTSLPSGIVSVSIPDISSGIVSLPAGVGTTTIQYPKFRRGYTYSYNLTVEQQYKGFTIDAGYVAARGIRPLINMNINAAPAGGGSAGRTLNAKFGTLWSDVNSLTPGGHSYYDSLQTKVTRRLGDSSVIGAVYTWSKTINFEDNEELGSLMFPYAAYFARNKARASFDRPHNLEVYWLYDLPFGKGKRFVQSGIPAMVAGGWKFSGVMSLVSGMPFSITDTGAGATNLNAPGNTQTVNVSGPIKITKGRPDQTPGDCTKGDTSCSYFDLSNITRVTTAATFGNAGRNILRGPGYFDIDSTISRDFKLRSYLTFQFEAQVVGLTNTPHFGNPASDFNSSNFGKITSTLATTNASMGGSGGERQWWFGGKFMF